MTILAGIDEAGFGPLLGPLVVSSCAFAVAPEHVEADLWQVLRKSVGKTRAQLRARLLITDSKKAYKRDEGLGHLERTVLAAMRSLGQSPATLSGLLKLLCPECQRRVMEYPWYRGIESQPLPSDRAELRIAAAVFADDMAAARARLVGVSSYCLDVAYYNALTDRMKNKSQVLFVTTTRLLQGLMERFGDQDLHILIDRQGGRVHYREHLLRSFEPMELRIVEENERRSAYVLRGGSRCVHLSFEVGADERHLPVSLASMVSKYIRELLMERMNRYFAQMSPDLRPTAGYWTDGLRFLEDLARCVPDLQIDRHRLVRCR
jgi:ribonuclease HII